MTTTLDRPTETVTRATVAGADFLDLATAGIFASRDQARPAINVIHFTTDASDLTATATDSYRLVRITRPMLGISLPMDTEALEVSVPLETVTAFAKTAKAGVTAKTPWSVTIEATEREVTLRAFANGVTYCQMTASTDCGQFPKVDQLIPEIDGIAAMPALGFDPRLLADVAKLAPWCNAKKGETAVAVMAHAAEASRAFVITGAGTLVLIMPVRIK